MTPTATQMIRVAWSDTECRDLLIDDAIALYDALGQVLKPFVAAPPRLIEAASAPETPELSACPGDVPATSAEGRYRSMRQRAREAWVKPDPLNGFISVLCGSANKMLWDGSIYDQALVNLGLAFNDTPEGRALAEEAIEVYKDSIFREWER